MSLQHFIREETDGQVIYGVADGRRKLIVTVNMILPIGNWQNAPGEQMHETPALFAAAVADQKTLAAFTLTPEQAEGIGRSLNEAADQPDSGVHRAGESAFVITKPGEEAPDAIKQHAQAIAEGENTGKPLTTKRK